MEWIFSTDVRVLFWLHRLAGPHMNSFITLFTTGINCLWLWLGLAAAGLWNRRSRWMTLTIIVAVIIAIFIGDVVLKHAIMRLRPYIVIDGAPAIRFFSLPGRRSCTVIATAWVYWPMGWQRS